MSVDPSFTPPPGALARAITLLDAPGEGLNELAEAWPEQGVGDLAALERLAPHVVGAAARRDAPDALAHMDPPAPWVTWAASLWNAALNQNLLHPATAPFACEAERRVIAWLLPEFGMGGGWMASGSTVANLTALWAARDQAGARRVVASADAHVSVEKSARLLGLPFARVPVTSDRRLDPRCLPPLDDACLVLTAGTNGSGAIDDLTLGGGARWRQVDAAWAGPLRLSPAHRHRLDGVERADSVAVSAHKLLFQPKGSALVLFKDADAATSTLGYGGGYLAAPNIGVEGSRGATAVPLLATLLAWGRSGLAERLDRCMAMASTIEQAIAAEPKLRLLTPHQSGVLAFRPSAASNELSPALADATFSLTRFEGEGWFRCVCANPLADVATVLARVEELAE